jgi:predicted nuclease of restriction endonuclease-like RecB superfamily
VNDQVAQKIADRLNELADSFADHARRAAEDVAPAVAAVADRATAEITARDERIRALEEQQAAILRIVAEWCTEYWEVGGINASDLEWRLQQAGHPLPTDGEDTDQ